MQGVFFGKNRQLQRMHLTDWANLGWRVKAGHPVSLVFGLVSNRMSVASSGNMRIN